MAVLKDLKESMWALFFIFPHSASAIPRAQTDGNKEKLRNTLKISKTKWLIKGGIRINYEISFVAKRRRVARN